MSIKLSKLAEVAGVQVVKYEIGNNVMSLRLAVDCAKHLLDALENELGNHPDYEPPEGIAECWLPPMLRRQSD